MTRCRLTVPTLGRSGGATAAMSGAANGSAPASGRARQTNEAKRRGCFKRAESSVLGATEPPYCRLGGHLRAPRSFRPIARVMRKPLADDRVRHFATPSSRERVGDAGVVGGDDDDIRVVCHERAVPLSAQGSSGATSVGQAQQRLSAAATPPTVSGNRSATARRSSTLEPAMPPRLLVNRARMIAFADRLRAVGRRYCRVLGCGS